MPVCGGLHLWRQGNALADALMRAGMVEVAGVLPDHLGQVTLIEDKHVVEALAMQAGKKPLAM